MYENKKYIYRTYGIDEEDLIQVGELGIWLAVKSYSSSKSAIQTYIINMIKWTIRDYIKSLKPVNEQELADDYILEDEQLTESTSVREYIVTLKDKLTPRQYRILKMAMKEMTQRDIGDVLGVSRTIVNKEMKVIRRKYEEVSEENGLEYV